MFFCVFTQSHQNSWKNWPLFGDFPVDTECAKLSLIVINEKWVVHSGETRRQWLRLWRKSTRRGADLWTAQVGVLRRSGSSCLGNLKSRSQRRKIRLVASRGCSLKKGVEVVQQHCQQKSETTVQPQGTFGAPTFCILWFLLRYRGSTYGNISMEVSKSWTNKMVFQCCISKGMHPAHLFSLQADKEWSWNLSD